MAEQPEDLFIIGPESLSPLIPELTEMINSIFEDTVSVPRVVMTAFADRIRDLEAEVAELRQTISDLRDNAQQTSLN
jgi:uncharacterized protein (UPF0335 family)